MVFIRSGSFGGYLESKKYEQNQRMHFRCSEGGPMGPSKNHCFYKVLELWGAIRAKRDLPPGPSEEPFDVKMGSQKGLLVSVVNLDDFPLFS